MQASPTVSLRKRQAGRERVSAAETAGKWWHQRGRCGLCAVGRVARVRSAAQRHGAGRGDKRAPPHLAPDATAPWRAAAQRPEARASAACAGPPPPGPASQRTAAPPPAGNAPLPLCCCVAFFGAASNAPSERGGASGRVPARSALGRAAARRRRRRRARAARGSARARRRRARSARPARRTRAPPWTGWRRSWRRRRPPAAHLQHTNHTPKRLSRLPRCCGALLRCRNARGRDGGGRVKELTGGPGGALAGHFELHRRRARLRQLGRLLAALGHPRLPPACRATHVHVLGLACACAARHLLRPVAGLRPRRGVRTDAKSNTHTVQQTTTCSRADRRRRRPQGTSE